MIRVIPDGPFVEVPYALLGAWTAGGYTWDDLVTADGLPAIVRERLTSSNRAWCTRVVRVYRDADDYRQRAGAATMGCPVGRAWLGPGADVPVKFITGVMSPPIGRTARGGYRWR